jgi:hypothetical protein
MGGYAKNRIGHHGILLEIINTVREYTVHRDLWENTQPRSGRFRLPCAMSHPVPVAFHKTRCGK